MILKRSFCLTIFTMFCFCKMSSQSLLQKNKTIEDPSIKKIKWNRTLSFLKKEKMVKMLLLDGGGHIEEKDFLPYYLLREPCKQGFKLKPKIEPVLTEPLTAEEETYINPKYITEYFDVIETTVNTYRKEAFVLCKLVPIRINKATGKLEKLVSYRVQWQLTKEPLYTKEKRGGNPQNRTQNYANSSVLANGTWYKIGTAQNAIYKIDKAFLQRLSINTGTGGIDPRNIKIYGNGGEILSELNSDFHYDDLNENAIFIQGEADGVFNDNDYILFYGQSPHKWKYNSGNVAAASIRAASIRYSHEKHYYSDSVFYFLTVDNSSFGKRIVKQANNPSPNYTVTTFDDYQVHENDQTNLVQSGRELYGENFDNTQSYSFNFSFLNIVANDTVWLKTDLLGRSTTANCVFDVNYPGGTYQLTTGSVCSSFECDIADTVYETGVKYFNYNGGSNISVSVNNTTTSQTGWINYLWIIARRALTMQGSQMSFRDYRSISPGRISQFNVQNVNPIRIWNVTNQFNIIEQEDTAIIPNNYTFSVATDTLQQFIAFDGTSYNTPAFVGTVDDHVNLHALQNIDYVIVAPSIFMNDAKKLANLHAQYEHFSYAYVTPDQIYNEFSSGVQDITAIRQFMRMLYKKPGTTSPKHLCLFGTGSYLQKDRYEPSNTVFVPVFETYNSWSVENSKTGDDFYGFLDDAEGFIDVNGGYAGSAMDIGVGRLTVKSTTEADAVTNKIIQYYNRTEPTSSCCDQATQNTPDWRNWVCLISDDVNPGGNAWEIAFIEQQEANATVVSRNPRYNINKIYEDAYQVETVPGGRRYPDVVTAINNQVAKGALIMGYSGHGGELNLSHENIVSINQIEQWNNINNMPLWYTATCEFATYDNPSLETAGEDILLNPNGGGIGLFTTTRIAFVSDGDNLGPPFYGAALDSFVTGNRPTMGDILRLTKFYVAQKNYLHFALLGDPAVTLSYPKQYTRPVKINSHLYVATSNDTLSALGKYSIVGYVSDSLGDKLNNFIGNIYITVFDKPTSLTTLDNAGDGIYGGINHKYPFTQQESILFKGKSTVTNGNFTYTFIVPKDIMYNYGLGKISYYAQQNDTIDAAGYYNQIMVGGTSNAVITDHQGPIINLFMNDNHFVSGGTTNQNPFIYALLADSSGINTSGTGIGHNVVATLDANTAHEIVLNDYYQADVNKYQSGKLLYQLSNLPNGNHTLNLKAWDVVDNSSNNTIDFVVAQNAQMALSHVLNYPNPFSNATKFYVEHNQPCQYLNVEIEIFTITGKVVKTISQTVENQGFRTDGINWDGKDNYGDKLARGVYIYKVIVKNTEEGSKAEKIEKLVILN